MKGIVVGSCLVFYTCVVEPFVVSLENLNNSLHAVAAAINSRPSVPDVGTGDSGTFDNDFTDVSVAFKVIENHKKAQDTFRFNVIKKSGERPYWFIEPVSPQTDNDRKTLAGQTDHFGHILGKQKALAKMIFMGEAYMGIFSTSARNKSFHSLIRKELLPYSTENHTRILLIPRKEKIVSIVDLEKEGLQSILKKAATIAKAFNANEYEIEINDGWPLQAVPHLHMHLTMYHEPFKQPLFNVVELNKWDGKLLFPSVAIEKAMKEPKRK